MRVFIGNYRFCCTNGRRTLGMAMVLHVGLSL